MILRTGRTERLQVKIDNNLPIKYLRNKPSTGDIACQFICGHFVSSCFL